MDCFMEVFRPVWDVFGRCCCYFKGLLRIHPKPLKILNPNVCAKQVQSLDTTAKH